MQTPLFRAPSAASFAMLLLACAMGVFAAPNPAPQASPAGAPAPKPLYRDPMFDGAADPVVIWNPHVRRWWMFYTNRRANARGLTGVSWVHGTRIGIAESGDQGASWNYVGTAEIELPEAIGGKEPSQWAPEIVTAPDGKHHMFLSVVPGIFQDWQHPRAMVHLTSDDLRSWSGAQVLNLASDRVIDACVLRLSDGSWRIWYNDERDRKSIHYADSRDLYEWRDRGKTVGDQPGEGPKVFQWKGRYWMVTDVWDGLAVYQSEDALHWERQSGGNLLQKPGRGPDDQVKGGHPDVVVNNGRAYLFYFTHPGRIGGTQEDGPEQRRSSIQVVELFDSGGRLECDRDQTTYIYLRPW